MTDDLIITIAWQLGIALVAMFLLMTVGWAIQIKLKVRNRIVCFFLEPNRSMTVELLKIPVKEPIPVLVSPRDELNYALDVEKQETLHYPSGAPFWVQETVAYQVFIRGQCHPVDVRHHTNGHEPGDSAAVLKAIKNVSFGGEMINKFNADHGVNKLSSFQMWTLIGLGVVTLGLGAVGYLSFRTYQTMTILQRGITG